MSRREQDQGFATRAIHTRMVAERIPSRAISLPIHSASFAFEHMEDIAPALHDPEHNFSYSRLSNPTVDALEHTLADLEGADSALGFGSGMAAIHAALVSRCRAGDHIVAPASLYGGTFSLMRDVLPRFGIETTFVETGDLARIREVMRPSTKVVYAETIGNPIISVADLPRLAEVAHAGGATLVVDSTFASPYLCRPLEHGADLVVHSASKYLGGHGDLIAGVVAGPSALMEEVRAIRLDTGGTLAPFVAWLIVRGLKTLALRMTQHSASALRIAEHLERHPRVSRVLYPGLPSHPDHAVAERMLPRGRGGMIAFELRMARADTARALDRLTVIERAGSLGDTHTLVIQPATTSHRQMSPAELRAAGISEGFVRLSVGLEDVADLIGDLDRALA